MKKFMATLLLALAGCATSQQDTPTKQNLGEGNKDMSIAMFDSVATTQASAKLTDREDARGGDYEEPVTYQEIIEEPYEVTIPVLDEAGAPVFNADGTPQTVTETRYRKTIVVRPVLGPDGRPLMRRATGFRNLVLNYGNITQTQTSSGESSGSQEQGVTPTSSPTNTPNIQPEIPVGPGN